VYYRQRDVETAEALSRRTGPLLVQSRNNGLSQGAGASTTANWPQGYTEREQPLLMPHEVLQLDAEHVIAFAGGIPPACLDRIDWRTDPELLHRTARPAPSVAEIVDQVLTVWQPPTAAVPVTLAPGDD
jgi:type IV secretory pathway TraG/TraD family ATPase VirD4